ncbi:hypothetical protein Tco_0513065, partial [Tanacetum coccineum]
MSSVGVSGGVERLPAAVEGGSEVGGVMGWIGMMEMAWWQRRPRRKRSPEKQPAAAPEMVRREEGG